MSEIPTKSVVPAGLDLGRPISEDSRILVAMSGGVDSALTAVLLRRGGFECVGINMRTYHPTDAERHSGRKFQTCCSPEDASDARSVALGEDFPFYVLDLEQDFHKAVVQPFINEYMLGRTPNPCVLCNNHLKLGLLLDKARLYGCDFVATGHYARIVENTGTGRMELHRAADKSKDQTYYLFGLRQDQLQRFVCPLGSMPKTEVRQLARDLEISVADKPDSMEICFVPGNDYRAFLRSRVDASAISSGDIVTTTGKVLGKHEGIAFYTIGQRKGLGLSHAEPLYVIDILASENLVVVGESPETYSGGLVCNNTNWVAIPAPLDAIEATAQIRYRHEPAACTIIPQQSGEYKVVFHEPQRSITPGQAVVFYEGESVLGGGWISSRMAASN